jgi:hypothetical protein
MYNLRVNEDYNIIMEEEVRKSIAQLREKHTEEQNDLDFRQDNEIADVQHRCNHDFAEPRLESYDYADFLIRKCNICDLCECSPFNDSAVIKGMVSEIDTTRTKRLRE